MNVHQCERIFFVSYCNYEKVLLYLSSQKEWLCLNCFFIFFFFVSSRAVINQHGLHRDFISSTNVNSFKVGES